MPANEAKKLIMKPNRNNMFQSAIPFIKRYKTLPNVAASREECVSEARPPYETQTHL